MSGSATEQNPLTEAEAEALINIDKAVTDAVDKIETSFTDQFKRVYGSMELRNLERVNYAWPSLKGQAVATTGARTGGGMCEDKPKVKLAVNAVVILALAGTAIEGSKALNQSFGLFGLASDAANAIYNTVSTSITSAIEVGSATAKLAGTTSGAVVDAGKAATSGVKNTLYENIGNLFSFGAAASVGRYYKTGISAVEDYTTVLENFKLAKQDIIGKRNMITRSMNDKIKIIEKQIQEMKSSASAQTEAVRGTAATIKQKYTQLVDIVCSQLNKITDKGQHAFNDINYFKAQARTYIGNMLNVTGMNDYDGTLGGRKSKRRNTRKSSKSRKNKKSYKKHKKKSHKKHKKKSHKGKKHKKKTNKRR
jgi:hypothetical protein